MTRYTLSDLDKDITHKVIESDLSYRVFMGVYCSQGMKASNHKELKVRIINAM